MELDALGISYLMGALMMTKVDCLVIEQDGKIGIMVMIPRKALSGHRLENEDITVPLVLKVSSN